MPASLGGGANNGDPVEFQRLIQQFAGDFPELQVTLWQRVVKTAPQLAAPLERKYDFDLLVIGAGPAGVNGAVQAAQMGASVCVVDGRDDSWILPDAFGAPSGLPSKALRSVVVDNLEAGRVVPWSVVMQKAAQLLHKFDKRKRKQMGALNVSIKTGYARFKDCTTVMLSDGSVITAEKTHICVGSKRMLPTGQEHRGRVVAAFPPNDPRFMTSDHVNSLNFQPSSVAIWGMGIIAVEMAAIFAHSNIKVLAG